MRESATCELSRFPRRRVTCSSDIPGGHDEHVGPPELPGEQLGRPRMRATEGATLVQFLRYFLDV
jgi:hypothetical protein